MIGKSVAKKPYMNLRLNNNVTDTGTGGNTPTNSGVTFTTDQFGRSNMAGNWDAITDRLSWAISIGNTIATKINAGATVLYWIKQNTFSDFRQTNIFHQWAGSPNRSFLINHVNFSTVAIDAVQIYNSADGIDANNVLYIENILSYNNWTLYSVVYTDNITDLNIKVTVGSNSGSGTTTKVYESSNVELRLGARGPSNILGDFGDMSNFRFYDVTLTDGQIKILNNQKGRIVA